MPHDPFEVQRLCADLGGIARTDEFTRAGVERSAITRALLSGAIVRIREGVYAHIDTPADVQTAVVHGGALGCVSRLRASAVWVLDDDLAPHVVLGRAGHRRSHEDCNCVSHWSDAAQHGGVVSLIDALAQVLGCLGAEGFFVSLESMMRLRLIDRAGLARLRTRVPRKWHWLIDFARSDADSGLESLLRFRLRRHRITLASQVSVPGVGRVDFVLGDCLILEVDGRPGHEGASNRHKDLVRDAVAAAHGFDTLRFDYAMVVHDWDVVEAAILAKVERGLHLSRRVSGTSR